MAFSQFQNALSSALNFSLTAVNVENRFAWLFGSFGVTAVVAGTIFFFTYVFLSPLLHAVSHAWILDSVNSTGWRRNSTPLEQASVRALPTNARTLREDVTTRVTIVLLCFPFHV